MQEAEVVLSVLRERDPGRARGINRWRARCGESSHAGFGGRLPGKGPHSHGMRDLAGQPTLLGVTSHQGVRESRTQGEGAQVVSDVQGSEVRVMRMAATVLDVIRDPIQK
jgi:hypothetical protein